ncbi:MAG: hypothetical protein EAZ27_13475 [Cytophagales bacterium]|nr:MAG: hypothetical protein EAZ27_13475 [Cytophagales bacterium]
MDIKKSNKTKTGVSSKLSSLLFFQDFIPLIYITIVLILAYFQVATLKFIMKWDMIDSYFSFIFYLSECIKNGFEPLWNPYQCLGYPFFADPSSGAYYIPNLIVGLFYNINFKVINMLYFGHVIVGAFGMYFLSKYISKNKHYSIISSLMYGCSGFLIGNAQHYNIIISGAWLPYVFLSVLLILDFPSFINSLKLAISLHLFMVGGYPGLIIFLFYPLIIFIFFKLYFEFISKSLQLKKVIYFSLISIVFLLIMSFGYFYSVFKTASATTRATGISLEFALTNSFTLPSFSTFLFPLSAINNSFTLTDLSMNNAYFSVIGFLILLLLIFTKLPKISYLYLFLSIFCICASVGNLLPFREFLYNFVPGFNITRNNGMFRMLFIFFFIIIIAGSIDTILTKPKKLRYIIIIISFICFYTFILFYSKYYIDLHRSSYNNQEEYNILNYFYQIYDDGKLLIIFLLFFAIIIFSVKNKIRLTYLIIFLISLELIMSTNKLSRICVYGEGMSIKLATKIYNANVKYGFNNNQENIDISDINDGTSGVPTGAFTRNLNTFAKKTAYDGYNSFVLKDFNKFINSKKMSSILNNLLVFQPENVYILSDSLKNNINYQKSVFIDSIDFINLDNKYLKYKSKTLIENLEIYPNLFKFKTTNYSEPSILTLNQNYYKGWEATIDNIDTKIIKSNLSVMSILVPKGVHQINFNFKLPNIYYILFLFQIITFTFIFLMLLMKVFIGRNIAI